MVAAKYLFKIYAYLNFRGLNRRPSIPLRQLVSSLDILAMFLSNTMQRLSASTAAVALAFSPLAQADAVAVHPILSSDVAINYRPDLYNIIAQATLKATGSRTDSGMASLSAGSLLKRFEAVLAKPLDRPQMVWSITPADLNGKPVPASTIVVGAVVPPKALYPTATTKNYATYAGNPAVCAYMNDVVLWKGVVNAFNGKVTTDTSPDIAPAAGKSVCQPYLLAKGQAMIVQAGALQAGTEPLPPLAQAQSAAPANESISHPLLTVGPALIYKVQLPRTLVAVTSNNASNDRADGFISELERALKAPSETVRIVDYPPRANADLLRIIGVVPPKSMEQVSIPFCAEQFNKVIGTWAISPKGEVAPTPWAGSKVSASPTSSACKDFIFAARNTLNSIQATTDPVPPAPSINEISVK